MQPIMTISGIRGKVGESLSASLYTIIAYLQTKTGGGGRILVGRDTRPSGHAMARAAFRGIRLAGGVPVDIGIAPTPTTCFAVDHFSAAGGIIITASHNPLPYNGYKMVHRSGRLFSGTECETIYKQYRMHEYPVWENPDATSDTPAEVIDAVSAHVDRIVSVVDSETIRQARLKVAVDATNGAAGAVFPSLLAQLGVEWEGVHTALDGNFIHNPEPRPEHLGDLAALLSSRDGFMAGFAFDPDADRLAPMGENGQPLSEELTLALALQTVLQHNRGPVATNLSTSMVIDDVARAFDVQVLRTRIGEAHVVEALLTNGCVAGGEGNGGVIYPAISCVRDGLAAVALILERMAQTGKPISELARQWPSYQIVKEKIPVAGTDPARIIEKLTRQFASETVDTQDGLKIIREYGWVHVRPSNTEPILRCYAEARTPEQAKQLAAMVMDTIAA